MVFRNVLPLAKEGQSMRNKLVRRASLACLGGVLAASVAGVSVATPATAKMSRSGDTIVVQWNAAALQGVRDSTMGPPMVARALAIVHTCIFDAWAAYNSHAVGTRLGGMLRRPVRERTAANKRKTISYAAYRAAVDLFPADTTTVFDPLMVRLGYDPSNRSTDVTTPTGIGNVACKAVLDFRHHDGSNQLGDTAGGTPGVPYSDYTGYTPANKPMDIRVPFDPSTVTHPNKWQPLTYVDGSGKLVTQKFVGAQWDNVVPFALTSASQFRSATGPAKIGSSGFIEQARELLNLSANLTDEQKMIAEYWANGPRTELPPGHWDLFAQYVSRRDYHGRSSRGVDLDAQMFFALTNAIFDAGIASWDDKVAFDSVRPITAIRELFRGQQVLAWGGPYQGRQWIDGGSWFPYQPTTFPTPPFPEYASGHSTFSAAAAEILKLFTGSDYFGDSVTFAPGSSTIESGAVPASTITLSWPTFSAAADQAGMSRRYGGIHFKQGDLDGRRLGREVAHQAWAQALTYINGTDR
jgi:hypothetical protein